MFINVQFKNAKKEFIGREYSFELCADEEVPKEKAIVRLMDENYNWLFNGTRVKIISCEEMVNIAKITLQKVRYVVSSMEE